MFYFISFFYAHSMEMHEPSKDAQADGHNIECNTITSTLASQMREPETGMKIDYSSTLASQMREPETGIKIDNVINDAYFFGKDTKFKVHPGSADSITFEKIIKIGLEMLAVTADYEKSYEATVQNHIEAYGEGFDDTFRSCPPPDDQRLGIKDKIFLLYDFFTEGNKDAKRLIDEYRLDMQYQYKKFKKLINSQIKREKLSKQKKDDLKFTLKGKYGKFRPYEKFLEQNIGLYRDYIDLDSLPDSLPSEHLAPYVLYTMYKIFKEAMGKNEEQALSLLEEFIKRDNLCMMGLITPYEQFIMLLENQTSQYYQYALRGNNIYYYYYPREGSTSKAEMYHRCHKVSHTKLKKLLEMFQQAEECAKNVPDQKELIIAKTLEEYKKTMQSGYLEFCPNEEERAENEYGSE